MTSYILSPDARRDAVDLVEYIGADNEAAAFRVRDRLFAAFDRLAEQPGLGHVRDDLIRRDAGVRFWPIGTYLVVYRPAVNEIQIVRVLSGYRDVAAILGAAPG